MRNVEFVPQTAAKYKKEMSTKFSTTQNHNLEQTTNVHNKEFVPQTKSELKIEVRTNTTTTMWEKK